MPTAPEYESAVHYTDSLSASVNSMRGSLSKEPVTTAQIATRLCEMHANYYSAKLNRAIQPLSKLKSTTKRPVDDWIGDVGELIDQRVMDRLDTAAMLLGLGLVDGQIFSIFHRLGILNELIAELSAKVSEAKAARDKQRSNEAGAAGRPSEQDDAGAAATKRPRSGDSRENPGETVPRSGRQDRSKR